MHEWSRLAAAKAFEELRLELETTPLFPDAMEAANFALHYGIRTQDKKFIEAMLKLDASIDGVDDGYPPLHTAVEIHDPEMTRFLIELGANPNIRTMEGTPLHQAAEFNDTNVGEVLISHGANFDEEEVDDKYTPLMLAAHLGHEEMVRLLLKHGAPVTYRNRFGETAYAVAAKSCQRYLKE